MRYFVIISLLPLCACTPINKYLGLKDDNFGEEMVEKAIEMKFNIDIDLSPESPE